jgi:hypothetical protein
MKNRARGLGRDPVGVRDLDVSIPTDSIFDQWTRVVRNEENRIRWGKSEPKPANGRQEDPNRFHPRLSHETLDTILVIIVQ